MGAKLLHKSDLPLIEQMVTTKKDREAGVLQLQWYLEQHYDDIDAWKLLAAVLSKRNHHALSRLIYEHILELDKTDFDVWHELSKIYNNLMLEERSIQCCEAMMDLDPTDARGPLGMCVANERMNRIDDALVWGERTLELDPENRHARATLGFCYLHKRDFERGWEWYHAGLGHLTSRDKHTYVGEPEWDGSEGAHIAVYSEQGLGDQIAGIEPLRDFPGTVTALSVDEKLRPWFARCFPDIRYHGSDIGKRAQHPRDPLRIDASINLFGLHKFLRRSEDAYPKTPYLTPHPRKAAMWRAALDRLGNRPKIGIAWSGGVWVTQARRRTHELADWAQLFAEFDVDFISLEYRDRDDETAEAAQALGRPIHVWPEAIRSADYEDTAALISQLDAVVAPPTTVVHAAGAMGVPCVCLVHDRPNPHYCLEGDRMPYYGSVELVRTDIEDVCLALSKYLSATTR